MPLRIDLVWSEMSRPGVAVKPISPLTFERGNGAVGETRTRDRRFRKPLLYPAELPPREGEKCSEAVAFASDADKAKTTLDLGWAG